MMRKEETKDWDLKFKKLPSKLSSVNFIHVIIFMYTFIYFNYLLGGRGSQLATLDLTGLICRMGIIISSHIRFVVLDPVEYNMERNVVK